MMIREALISEGPPQKRAKDLVAQRKKVLAKKASEEAARKIRGLKIPQGDLSADLKIDPRSKAPKPGTSCSSKLCDKVLKQFNSPEFQQKLNAAQKEVRNNAKKALTAAEKGLFNPNIPKVGPKSPMPVQHRGRLVGLIRSIQNSKWSWILKYGTKSTVASWALWWAGEQLVAQLSQWIEEKRAIEDDILKDYDVISERMKNIEIEIQDRLREIRDIRIEDVALDDDVKAFFDVKIYDVLEAALDMVHDKFLERAWKQEPLSSKAPFPYVGSWDSENDDLFFDSWRDLENKEYGFVAEMHNEGMFEYPDALEDIPSWRALGYAYYREKGRYEPSADWDIVRYIKHSHMGSLTRLVHKFITGPRAGWVLKEPELYYNEDYEYGEEVWNEDGTWGLDQSAFEEDYEKRMEAYKNREGGGEGEDREIARLILSEMDKIIKRDWNFSKKLTRLRDREEKLKNEIKDLKKEIDSIKPSFVAARIYLDLLETQLGRIDPMDPEQHRALYWSRAKQATLDLP